MLLVRLACCLVLMTAFVPSGASELSDQQAQALDIIAGFASKICHDIPLSGNSTAMSGKLDAELAALFKKLAKAGVEVEAEAKTEKYQNVLQADLLTALKNSTDCKLQVADKLYDRILPKERSGQRVPSVGIMFPKVVADIGRGDFDSVPDDQYFRSYIVSFYKGMYDVCVPGGDGIGMAAGRYGFPQVRAFDNPDPYASLTRLLLDVAEVSRSGGSLTSIQAMSADHPRFFPPAIDDGIAYASELNCRSAQVMRLRSRMGLLMERRQGAPAEPNDSRRWTRLMSPEFQAMMGNGAPAIQVSRDQLHKACVEQIHGLSLDSDKEQWCGCAIRLAVGGGVDLSLQNEMLGDFEWALGAAKKKNPQFERALGQCAV